MERPALPWHGGCRCGQTRLVVEAAPLLTSACHCTGCQTMTGSAFSLSVTVPADGFAVTAGEPAIGGARSPGVHHWHCSRCMIWLYTTADAVPQIVNVRAGALDDHRWFAPFAEFWTAEQLPWATTGAVRRYEGAPQTMAEFEELLAAYASA